MALSIESITRFCRARESVECAKQTNYFLFLANISNRLRHVFEEWLSRAVIRSHSSTRGPSHIGACEPANGGAKPRPTSDGTGEG
jgi:hypothetical protein